MAGNLIDATRQVEELVQAVNLHTQALERSNDQLVRLNNEYANVPSEFIQAQRESARLQRDQANARAAEQRALTAAQNTLRAEANARSAVNRERGSEILLQERQARQANRVNREREREQRALRRLQGFYNRAQQRLNALTAQYNELSVRKQLFNNLNRAEESSLQQLEGQINRYQNVLASTDARIGRFQRNVGNYSGAWNGLGNALNQLTREAPAFANSLQTGFLAISNNLPILVDEINRLTAANRELTAQGQPTTSVLRQITSALFSWQTAISIGVTLLTIYGAELFELARSYFNLEEGIDRVADTQERLNEINEEFADSASKAGEGAAAEAAKLLILRDTAEDVTLTSEQRNKAVDMLLSQYPEYFRGLEREALLNGEATDSYNRLNREIIRRAQLTVAQQRLEQLVALQLENEISRRVGAARISEEAVNNTLAQINEESTARDEAAQSEASAAAERIRNFAASADAQEEDINVNLQRRRSIEGAEEAGRQQNQQIDESNALIQEEIDAVLNLIQGLGGLEEAEEAAARAQANRLDVNEIGTTVDQLRQLDREAQNIRESLEGTSFRRFVTAEGEIDGVRTMLSFLAEDTVKFGEELIESFTLPEDELIAGVRRMADEVNLANLRITNSTKISAEEQQAIFEQLFSSFSRMYNLDIRAFTRLIGNKEATTSDYVDAAVEAANFILDVTRQNFQLELEAQRAMLQEVLDNENASDEQRQVARERFERREREIRTRQARAERTAAIIQVGIDTAAAIVKTLAQTGFVFGSPLIPIIAAIGAAQAAFIAAQPLPTFADGTQNAPEGWALTQERGPEIITDKAGKIKSMGEKGGSKLTYLKGGDKVFTAPESEILKDTMRLSAEGDHQQLKMTDGMIMLDYAFASMKEDIVEGSRKGVEQGLRKFRVINNNKLDMGHHIWKNNKGYA